MFIYHTDLDIAKCLTGYRNVSFMNYAIEHPEIGTKQSNLF